LPPAYRVYFVFIIIILLALAAWYWFSKEGRLTPGDEIQMVIAFVLTVTLIVVYLNLRSFQEFNQPLCAVKTVKVDPIPYVAKTDKIDKITKNADSAEAEVTPKNVIEISANIKNFGKYVARNTSYEWEVDIIENINSSNRQIRPIPDVPPGKSSSIDMLPEQEIDNLLVMFNEVRFRELVRGYESALRVRLNVVFQSTDDKLRQYSCVYLITRLKHPDLIKPEVTLKESKFITIPDKNPQSK